MFFNYKGTFSTILLAVADAQYRFLFVDVGAYGREGDASVFATSEIGKRLKKGGLSLPEPAPPPGFHQKILYNYQITL